MTTCPPLARLCDVHLRYGATPALAGVDLGIGRGEVLALLGPNGAGKTSALALLTGLRRPDAGRAELFGRGPRDTAARRRLGVMLQLGSVPSGLTVAEHLRLFASYYPHPRALAETLALADIADLAGRRYGALSGGQQRRVQFALALCGRPELLFVDEPTAGLDTEARRGFWSVLRGLVAEGVGVLLTTHHLEEADALADQVIVLQRGRVLVEGTPQAIKARVGGHRIRCTTALACADIMAWPETLAVDRSGARTEIRSAAPEALLRRLLAADDGVRDLEVASMGLEAAFIALTSQAGEAVA